MWCLTLIKKFKESTFTVLIKLNKETYSIDDTWNNQNISSYIYSVIQHAKAADIIDLQGQLT